MNTINIILVFSLTLGFSTLLAVTMLLFRQIREGRYNEKENRSELNELRAMFEHRMYDLQERLILTESRWKDVNHLLLDSQRVSGSDTSLKKQKVTMTSYLNEMGLSEKDLIIDPNLVFVLTPFHDKHQQTFEIIRNVCSDVGLTCLRGDEKYIDSNILIHILRQLLKARMLIVNIEGRNPNVFYELGLAHALGKPTILLSKSFHEAPFDVKSKRIIFYKHPLELRDLLRDELTRALVET